MLSFELLARVRKELFLTGSALYETIVAIAERVNRKVHVLRLHGQATTILNQIHAIHRQVGRRIAELGTKPSGAIPAVAPGTLPSLENTIRTASDRIKGQQTALQQIERHIRDLKIELAHEDLLTMQRELGLRDAAIERVLVAVAHRSSAIRSVNSTCRRRPTSWRSFEAHSCSRSPIP